MKYTYSLIWRNGAPPKSGKIAWHIRGIKEDGSFYGEIRFDSPDSDKRLATGIEGSISGKDLDRCLEILDRFSDMPIDRLAMTSISNVYYGVLGRRDKSSMRLLDTPFFYNFGDENKSDKARLFIELVKIMEKEISKSYYKIGQSSTGD